MWHRYKNYFLKYLDNSEYTKKDGLPYLRNRLFILIIITAFPLSLLIYIPSMFFLVKTNAHIAVIIDIISVLNFSIILLYKHQKISTKKILFFFNFYILALALLVLLGVKGPGIIIFLALSILCTLLINKKAGLISVAINAATLFLLLFGFSFESENLILFQEYNETGWFFTSLNFVILNLIIVFILAFFVDHLHNLVSSEYKLICQLQEESKNLLKAKQKSEESDKLKSAFLANMSHEIRTPMNGILGFSDLLENSKLTGEQHKEYIKIIQKSGKRMLRIINDIIDISKIEAGAMEVSIKQINLKNVVDSILIFFRAEAQKKGLELILSEGTSKNDFYINTDNVKLHSVLNNLVKNAIKYTDIGAIEFGYKSKSDYLEFFVKDTGIGIPENRQKEIFERFIQADIADKQARQGAGLGLSISKAYVEMLGGKIWIESEKGKGSTFYFTLPQNKDLRTEIKSEPIVSESTPLDMNLKILIAEDDDTSNEYLSILIKKYGKEVINVINGIEAVKSCQLHSDIDLILMDIQMPNLNGYEACKQIRKFNTDVIIIAQTAFGLSGDREKALKNGFNDYISKPINKKELDMLIKKYFK